MEKNCRNCIDKNKHEACEYFTLEEYCSRFQSKEDHIGEATEKVSIGIDEWKNQGKTYGYFDYMKRWEEKDFIEKLNKEIKEKC